MSASTTLLTDANALVASTPTAASNTKANNANGPIVDTPGAFVQYQLLIKEAKLLLTRIVLVTDAADPNLTTLNNDLLTLV